MQMGTSSWEQMPPDMAGEVMQHLKWHRGASAVFRKICKEWRDTHDQRVTRLSVKGDSVRLSSLLAPRFPRVKDIRVRRRKGARDAHVYYDEKWLRILADLTALTSLNLAQHMMPKMSELGLLAIYSMGALDMSGLNALANLNLTKCTQVSDDRFQALGSLTALTNLNLEGWEEASDGGLQALAGLTALTSLNLRGCEQVSDDGLRALAASPPSPASTRKVVGKCQTKSCRH
jgi:hypothetical protein